MSIAIVNQKVLGQLLTHTALIQDPFDLPTYEERLRQKKDTCLPHEVELDLLYHSLHLSWGDSYW